ncbi:alpha/beta hydrolase [Actinoplanes sp. NPDC051861]|uniref:alpha/beta fold hydrolase n=1 Tax=Actinoplanes sp. NPDC051861 TaxID=3155170 RepID=UPI00343E7095
MITETDLRTPDGRTLHAYSWGDGDRVVMWHHGTPNLGSPPRPLFAAAARLGIRFVSYDRPGYGGSSPLPGRDMASAAALATAVADALGVKRFAVLGHSSGGPHSLACAALLPDRVTAAVSISGLAPLTATSLDWFAGMGPASRASLGAAAAGREAKEAHAGVGRASNAAGPEATAAGPKAPTAGPETPADEPEAPGDSGPDFTPADWAALDGEWGWFGSVVEPAMANGPAPLIDDDLANAGPWGFDPATIAAPVLLVHGADDLVVPSSHSIWLAGQIRDAELRIIPGEGHVSVLAGQAVPALDWLHEHA